MARKPRKTTPSTVHFASLEDVAEYAAEISSQVLVCRDEKHRWRLYDIEGDSKTGFTRYHRCACKAMRVQTLDADGYIVSTRTDYPKGYQLPAGTGRLSRDGNALLRLASAQQAAMRFNVKAARRAR